MERLISHHSIVDSIVVEMTGAFQEEVPSIFPRKDVHSDDPFSMYQEIFAEGSRLAGVDTVELKDGRQILIFNSIAASPHTLFRLPYNDYDIDVEEGLHDKSVWKKKKVEGFKSIFKRHAEQAGILKENEVSEEYILIEENGQEKVPEVVPLDMLVWTMIRDVDGRIKPIDIGDFTSPPTGDPNIDRFRLQLEDDKLNEVFAQVVKRTDLASNILLDVYNNNIRTELPFLPEKIEKDVLQGVAIGFYRGDKAKMLEQFRHDGLGKGPMSNPSTHFRVTLHLAMETLRELRRLDPGVSLEDVIDYIRYKEVDGELVRSIHFAENVFLHETQESKMRRAPNNQKESKLLKDLIQPGNLPPIELLKLIDPYASIAHDLLSDWLVKRLRSEFSDYHTLIEPFAHHAAAHEREMRASEGVEITVFSQENDVREETLSRITKMVGETFSPLWEDVKWFVQDKMLLPKEEQDSRLRDIQMKYDLPDQVMAAIQRLMPTEKQIHNLRNRTQDYNTQRKIDSILRGYRILKAQSEKDYHEAFEKINNGKGTKRDLSKLVSTLQTLQLFDDWNEGYNIPGVPSFGITFHRDENKNTHVSLGWLLSMKGLAELWLGAMIIRPKRDSGS